MKPERIREAEVEIIVITILLFLVMFLTNAHCQLDSDEHDAHGVPCTISLECEK